MDYLDKARRVIGLELAELDRLRTRLDDTFSAAVEVMLSCVESKGKIVVVGVGKSGHIGDKIAATLTSTGSPAVVLNSLNALHGDLGVVADGDLILALSYSGETDELVNIIPALSRFDVKIVSMTGNPHSFLAQNSQVHLDVSVEQEACPLNLAPTTSTTVALAIGDALALTLMDCKKLTPEDFALNHPAGRIGKRLMLRVGDVMHSGARNPTIAWDAPLLEVVQAISRGGLGAVSILDAEGRLAGIITDGDLRRTLQRSRLADLETLTSSDVMTRNPVVTSPDTLAYAALQLMEDRPSQISVLPVVDEVGTCIGLLRLHDIIRSGL